MAMIWFRSCVAPLCVQPAGMSHCHLGHCSECKQGDCCRDICKIAHERSSLEEMVAYTHLMRELPCRV